MNGKDIKTLEKKIKNYAQVTHVVLSPINKNQVWKFGVITKDGEERLVLSLTDDGDICHLDGSFHLDFLNLLQSILKDIKRDRK